MPPRHRIRPQLQSLESRITPTLTPVGPEFRVNIPTYGSERFSSAMSVPGGDFLVAFHGFDDVLFPNTNYGVTVQRYHPNGVLVGSPIAVSETGDAADSISIAVDAAGNFVVVWTNWPGFTGPQSWSILARRFDAAGQPLGQASFVNSNSGYTMGSSKVTFLPDGDYVVTWWQKDTSSSFGFIRSRRFATDGTALSSASIIDVGASPRISAAPDGTYSIGWRDAFNTSSIKRFSPSGQALTGTITGAISYNDLLFEIICDSSDNTFVATGDGSVSDFHLSKFGPTGISLANWQAPTGYWPWPRMALTPDSALVLTYSAGSANYFRLIDSNLNVIGAPTQIKTDPYSTARPIVAVNAYGDAFFAWDAQLNNINQDGDLWDVYARCYAGAAARTAAPPSINGGTNGGSAADVKDVDVGFTRNVALPSNPATAFQLTTSTGTPIPVTVETTGSTATASKMKLTFPTYATGLPDGNYELKVLANQVHDIFGRPLDGNGDGTPGDDLVWHFHRLLGDFNGDSAVNNKDYLLFRNAVATSQPAFNLDGTGEVDQNDYLIFRNTIGNSLPAW